jgi:hypothetical protein
MDHIKKTNSIELEEIHQASGFNSDHELKPRRTGYEALQPREGHSSNSHNLGTSSSIHDEAERIK